MTSRPTRRELLKTGAAGAAALGVSSLGLDSLLARADAATGGRCGRLSDIEHVVILVQENRSFDHYFGSYRGVTGFDDPSGLFAQPGYDQPGYGGVLYPFHIDSAKNGDCTNDIDHAWGPQHRVWDGGAMDNWVREHLKDDGVNGPMTMGYYKRADLPFYYWLADNFTICDHYFCSVIGPTDPNRLYLMSGTIDPDGQSGGPLLETLVSNRYQYFGKFTWKTMPEQLEAAGVSWKVYSTPDGNYGDNVLPYFKAYQQNSSLAAKALTPTFPGTFHADCASGRLPKVSWVLSNLVQSEHPPAPVTWGEQSVWSCLRALLSNPKLWAKTALFVTFDENGGFFDHVPPPTAPAGTPGEYVTVSPPPSAADGITGPIGLGFRVPMLIVSPFTRGGFFSSDVFDHTSTLRFLETRFGVPVPNLSAWRRSVTGDLTSAFNFAAPPKKSVPKGMPNPSLADKRVIGSTCTTSAPISEIDEGSPLVQTYPVPPNSVPHQEPGSPRRPSGVC